MTDATPADVFRRRSLWAAVVLPAVIVGFASVAARRTSFERAYRNALAIEAKRRAIDISAQTMSGNVMGAVATMGLVNHPLKDDALGVVPPNGPLAMEPLRANGEAHRATALYVVDRSGIVRTCWYTSGNPMTGLDVGFRPYFRMAMQGRQNVSAGTSATTGKPALYVAAPLYEEVSSDAPIIGAVVARLGVERIDSVLRAWPEGPALLISPQGVAFTASRDDWRERTAQELTSERWQAIRALRQFSGAFDERLPQRLPFGVDDDAADVDGRRYAIARAPVQWNDPAGEWSLVLLGDLDAVMPAWQRALFGLGTGLLTLALGAVFLTWRRRLQRANAARAEAEAAQQSYAMKLYFDSDLKSFVADVSTELHQAETLADFARTFMSQVTTRVAADYGAFYVLDRSDGRLHPTGGYAVDASALETLAVGEGMVGQCAAERTAIVISEGAEHGIRVVWGAGSVAATSLLFLPLLQAGRLLGVVVFASVQAIDDEQRALLEALLPMAAVNLEMLQHHLGATVAP